MAGKTTKNILQISLFVSALSLFSYIWIQSAYLCDDAYVSFRTVDNFIHGLGLTWNPTERVQAFSNPFWVFLLAFAYLIFPDIYYISFFLSFTLSLLSILIGLIILREHSFFSKLMFIMLILSSRAFIDYTSSGLENPLTFVLISLFLLLFLKLEKRSLKNFFFLTLISALLFFNRIDSMLIILPAMIYCITQFLKRENLKRNHFYKLSLVTVALSPAWLWLTFSLIYYGFPFPNTAYAKIFVNEPIFTTLQLGLHYFMMSWKFDPLTLVTILLAIIFGFIMAKKNIKLFLLSLGLCLHCLYVLYIGGDFMAWRFFSVPFFLASIILIFSFKTPLFLRPHTIFTTLLIMLIGYNLTLPYSPIKNESTDPPEWDMFQHFGITDERDIFNGHTSLLKKWTRQKNVNYPDHNWFKTGAYYKVQPDSIIIHKNIGFLGYAAGPEKYIVDLYALSSAFLARLPAKFVLIGHYERQLPNGYVESLRTGKNQITDPSIAKLFDDINVVTKGPLFSLKRLKAIITLNLRTRHRS